MINSKYWMKKIDNDNNWWTGPKENNKKKNCVQHSDTLAPFIFYTQVTCRKYFLHFYSSTSLLIYRTTKPLSTFQNDLSLH